MHNCLHYPNRHHRAVSVSYVNQNPLFLGRNVNQQHNLMILSSHETGYRLSEENASPGNTDKCHQVQLITS